VSRPRPGVYVETSALGRVLLEEPDTPVILTALVDFEGRYASRLMRTELRRFAYKRNLLARVDGLLADVSLVPVDETVLEAASTVPPPAVGTLDAIHLATALALSRVGIIDALLTYDARLAAGAREHGLAVVSPGQGR
jgi:predicted nucleic acid-binding protein